MLFTTDLPKDEDIQKLNVRAWQNTSICQVNTKPKKRNGVVISISDKIVCKEKAEYHYLMIERSSPERCNNYKLI